jgi:DNA-directed RNA polymerase subunit delta
VFHLSNQAYPTLRISADQAKETAMVDLAFLILKTANTPFYYRDLMNEVARCKGYTDGQVREVIAQLYTEINVDGRFACVGNNLWGLKRWYPVDNKAEDAMGGKRPRIINDDDDLDEEDSFPEEEEIYTADEEDFDSFDEDQEELNEDEEEFFPEEAEEEVVEELEEELEEEEQLEDEEEEDNLDDEPEDDEK